MKTILKCILLFFFIFINKTINAQTPNIYYGSNILDSIEAISDANTYKLAVEEEDAIIIRANCINNSSFGIDILLIDTKGNQVDNDWSYGIARVNYKVPAGQGGDYIIRISEYGGNQTGKYNLSVQRSFTPNNSINIDCDSYLNSSLENSTAINAFIFGAKAGSTVNIRMNSPISSFANLCELYDEKGTLIKSDWSYGNAEIIATLPNDGCYTILAMEYHGSYNGEFVVNLSLLGGECGDYCSSFQTENCTNNEDDDGDNLIDCDDSDCQPLISNYQTVDESLFNNDGRIDICVEGGKLPYSLSYIPERGNAESVIGSCAKNMEISDLRAGYYSITITDANECSGKKVIKVDNPDKRRIGFPEKPVLTPNNDGKNDKLVFEGLLNFADRNEIVIYNRYGSILFRKKNYSNNWDARYNGKLLPADTYFYSLKTISEEGIEDVYNGFITVIR